MVIDYTITIGNIIEIGSIVGGGFAVFMTLKNNVANLKDDVTAMQDEIRELGKVLISIARFDEKISGLDKRVTAHDKEIYELRHGRGFIRGPAV
ncbi:hypothetical protein ASC80_05555 [Afipia sp. Root123D2]|uniref:hypothetical protein n=1 Tax=Afipia sp. Root123D2 TaxID=1736436 RepID=UPI0006FC3224|nr:hypothetical protein [Afipia sp. Root123D2]KQW22806.1 hypothetical protein ASC80_05555 [Afipia sp. Root123D2]